MSQSSLSPEELQKLSESLMGATKTRLTEIHDFEKNEKYALELYKKDELLVQKILVQTPGRRSEDISYFRIENDNYVEIKPEEARSLINQSKELKLNPTQSKTQGLPKPDIEDELL